MKTHPALRLTAAAALLAAGGAACAQATITHDKALAGSVTPGDAAGYPITISQPGSYKLMSNLVVPTGTNGIVVTAEDVTIDLNGFSIRGPILCTGSIQSISCPGAADTFGIRADTNALRNLEVRNGTVAGFRYGVSGGTASRVANMRLRHNGTGVTAAMGSLFSEIKADRCGMGVSLEDSVLRDSIISDVGTAVGGSSGMVIASRITAYYGVVNDIGLFARIGVRESTIGASFPVYGGVVSMGNNLSNDNPY